MATMLRPLCGGAAVGIHRRCGGRRYRATPMARHCNRPACAAEATATLTYHYGESLVWVDDLAPERDPHGYDLCELHAARLKVPAGWRLDDRRARAGDRQLLAG
jgi:hypothetical protein